MSDRILITAAAVCLLVSCTVKENRMACPCALDVTVHGGNDATVTLSMWNPSLQHSCTLNSDGKDRYRLDIPRGYFEVSACTGLYHNLPSDGKLILAEGEQMDELFVGRERLEAVQDSVTCSISVHKQYALINIKVVCMSENSLPDPIALCGNVCGIDILTLEPVVGRFEVQMHPIFREYCRVCVPRQLDDSLSMNIEGFGIVPLGEYISMMGYDWKAEDLDDLEVVVDMLEARVNIRITGWQEGRSFDLII